MIEFDNYGSSHSHHSVHGSEQNFKMFVWNIIFFFGVDSKLTKER